MKTGSNVVSKKIWSITREREELAPSETRLSSYGTSSKKGLSWPLCFFERANCTRRQLSFTLCSVNFMTQIHICKHPWIAKFPVQLSHACANETVPASRSWHSSPRGTNLSHGPNERHGGQNLAWYIWLTSMPCLSTRSICNCGNRLHQAPYVASEIIPGLYNDILISRATGNFCKR